MTHKHYTKDESFMISLYEEAKKSGEMDTSFDRYEIGQKAGLQEKGVDAICKTLLRTNFLKKEDERMIYLTPHGQKLVLALYEEQ